MLIVKNLTKTYHAGGRSVRALQSISLHVKAEEFVCLIGPNGCGKSTLLKLIAGIEQPTAGTLQANATAAYVPQQPSLLPWRTVEQNLALPADISRSARPDTRRWLRDFGLAKFAGHYPHTLSGGMQQKVAIIRAAVAGAPLLLLDEPFTALDALTRRKLQSWLLDFRQRTRATVVCVTHDIHEAAYLADTVYVLSPRPGRVKHRLNAASVTDLEAKLTSLVAA